MPIQPQVVITDAIVKQVASLAATGSSPGEIAAQMGTSKYHVKKILAMDQAKSLIKEIGDESTAAAKSAIRTTIGQLAKEVTRVITERLADNDLEAVKVALKVIGFDAQDATPSETNIQVILPGGEGTSARIVEGEFRTLEEVDHDE